MIGFQALLTPFDAVPQAGSRSLCSLRSTQSRKRVPGLRGSSEKHNKYNPVNISKHYVFQSFINCLYRGYKVVKVNNIIRNLINVPDHYCYEYIEKRILFLINFNFRNNKSFEISLIAPFPFFSARLNMAGPGI